MNYEMRQQIAQTILNQLGGNKFKVMTGSHSFGISDCGLHFKIRKNNTKASVVQIDLDVSKDLYTMIFSSFTMAKGLETVAHFEEVYAEDLQTVFKEFTGLDTSL